MEEIFVEHLLIIIRQNFYTASNLSSTTTFCCYSLAVGHGTGSIKLRMLVYMLVLISTTLPSTQSV